MADLINRQSAIDYCYALINAENPSDPSDEWNYSQERINQTEVILHHLEFMPSAQPEVLACGEGELIAQPEIVRCKDCKHWKDSDGVYRRGIGAESKCPVNIRAVYEGNFYCADAERRTDGN